MKKINRESMRIRLKQYIDGNFKSVKKYCDKYGFHPQGVHRVLRGERPVTQTYAATIQDGYIYTREDETLIKFKVCKDEKSSRAKKP